MKVLFLDVDGVLNSEQWFLSLLNDKKRITMKDELCPELVQRVISVVNQTDAKVVVSSTWRLNTETMETLVKSGIPIYSMTPKLDSGRDKEIALWLRNHTAVEQYAIVDDDEDAGLNNKDHFIQTDEHVGITEYDAERLIQILGRRDI